MTPITVDLVAAARPNFMKIAPPSQAVIFGAPWCVPRIVHTGQHYDERMSDWFFRDLELPTPYVNLEAGSGTHAEQTGRVMMAYERFCMEDRPNWSVVVGDVNSTLACALAARKIGIAVAHLEAGLRSRDRTMPEEINRIATDVIADLLWTPSQDADENLRQEGIPSSRVKLVGNIMIDAYEMLRPKIAARESHQTLGLRKGGYGVVTLHRPSNVDEPDQLRRLTKMLHEVSCQIPLVFPIHPRTRQRLRDAGIDIASLPDVRLIDPMGYVDFMSLVSQSRFALTDSGGIQEETTYLGIPCLTLRESTERPITITLGTNELVRDNIAANAVSRILAGQWKKGTIPSLWDGRTANRIVASLAIEVGVPRAATTA